MLVKELEPRCERLHIAGSVRREKPEDIKDIEVVAIPKTEPSGIFGKEKSNALNRYLDNQLVMHLIDNRWKVDGEERVPSWGALHRKYHRYFDSTLMTVDLYQTEAENFGHILMIRTGPRAFSMWYVMELKKRGFTPKGGRVWQGPKLIVTPEEATCFELLGIEPVAPTRRAAFAEAQDG
jgi:DNA polymerase/3'-5' exonuclease PolX